MANFAGEGIVNDGAPLKDSSEAYRARVETQLDSLAASVIVAVTARLRSMEPSDEEALDLQRSLEDFEAQMEELIERLTPQSSEELERFLDYVRSLDSLAVGGIKSVESCPDLADAISRAGDNVFTYAAFNNLLAQKEQPQETQIASD